jgi:hypothetical protein
MGRGIAVLVARQRHGEPGRCARSDDDSVEEAWRHTRAAAALGHDPEPRTGERRHTVATRGGVIQVIVRVGAPLLTLVCTAALTGCGGSVTLAQGQADGVTVTGAIRVVGGPRPTAPPSGPGAQGHVEIRRGSDTVSAQDVAAGATFTFSVPPGTYSLAGNTRSIPGCQSDPSTFRVRAGERVHEDLYCSIP